ncbi:MAG: helix-turn-helix domain-containing protein [Planctomycetota bacterium]|nr:helix-turn-helix domain-containing protein [Planctomycetota bacterium]
MERNNAAPRSAQPRRSICPVACALDLFGDRWTLLLIRDMNAGRSTFREFLRSPEKIASNILADRLSRLVNHGLVEKAPVPETKREAYRLTTRGLTLLPVLEAMAAWGLANIPGTEARIRPMSNSVVDPVAK